MSSILMHPHYNKVPYQEPHYLDPRLVPATRVQDGRAPISLPSIRQAFPDFDKGFERDRVGSIISPDTSPTAFSFTGAGPSPKYTVSPNQHKRRRVSSHEGNESDGSNPVPRVYAVPQQVKSRPVSPATESRLIHKPWPNPDNTRPYATNYTFWAPGSVNPYERAEKPPAPPSLPLKLEQGINEDIRAGSIPMYRHISNDYIPAAPPQRPSIVPRSGQWADVGGHEYRQAAYDGYGYSHPNRVQSLSIGPAHPNRTSFPPGAYVPRPQHETYMRMGDIIGAGGEKPRKRRGNLPKETTDKLRAWFVAHLHHPYPTEDEKQQLMRDTGLQMNQISNWFINARRRQLPAMISNARAESEATRAIESKTLSPNERRKYDRDTGHRSDSEGSGYEDLDTKSVGQRGPTNIKRGSI
ncbi:hypothetical protein GGR51DRAFT_189162 [Nemania sp. FL0031]|nr:hypothetical protein GGR51DRAFT_189162 [Nemania sp. FL0031]